MFDLLFAATMLGAFDGQSSSSATIHYSSLGSSVDKGAEAYKRWYAWYTSQGGVATHNYDYPASRRGFKVATNGSHFSGGYGVNSINVVVPPDVERVSFDLTSHDKVYFYDMEKMRTQGARIIPKFSDC